MLPELFVDRMKNLLPKEEFEAFIDSFGDTSERYHALRINTLKAKEENSFEEIKGKLSECFGEGLLEQVPWEENGIYYDERISPGKHPYHEAGLYYIQEPSAMAPVHFLDPKPGEKILDLCAAPGGKSTQIAVRMQGKGILISNEINRDRAKILSLNVERLGITNCMVLNETPRNLSERFEGFFDKILVDAPCSGEGMFRKNAVALTEWSPENVENCALRQKEILDLASKMLSPGGVLVYSTCTFAPAENEESIYRFIVNHSDFHVQDIPLKEGMENAREAFISKKCLEENGEDTAKIQEVKKAVRLWPHKLSGEGHFLCVLKRDGERLNTDSYVPSGKNLPAKKEILKIFETFLKETLVFTEDSANTTKSGLCFGKTIFQFGDQLYLAPDYMPSINGLKVMRPGLHLGTVKKDRFEPSHALALAMKAEDAVNTADFSENSSDIRQYLNGQTLRTGDKSGKGWTLVTVDGYSIGWAKRADTMLKNHYPKGLRINI